MVVSEEGLALRAGDVRAAELLETHLARVLRTLESERATGVLDVDAGGIRTTFYLREGAIVFAESGTVGETLGRVLVTRGVITDAQYRQILRRMTDALVHDELMRFGEVAIELGILSPDRVSEGLRAQMRARVVRCLQLDQARWIFREDLDAVASVARFALPLPAVLLESLAEPQEAARWAWRLASHAELGVVLAAPPSEIATRLGLGPAELRIVRALEGHPRVGEVLVPDAPDLEPRAAILATLLLLELAELRTITSITQQRAPSPEPVSTEVLRPASDDVAARASGAAARLREEVERRRNAGPTTRRDETRTRLSAEERYAEGRRWLREGKPQLALRELRAAAEQMPDANEYRLAEAFADWLCADDDIVRAAAHDLLAHWITQTLKADRRNALGHYAQGRIFAAAGDHAQALKAFTIASKLDPSDVEATRWVRITKQRAGAAK
ncbi:DUF4388 domain-containing protein [Sandaracinus amylolyticus]|uniref:DUF4388 domain-containing protein n=1 Tax=Sandaracinus amylolyticus TaxID=927083 RepID=UPI001F18CB24|nr:DUF4388 domain-containing protein [Sandaracinus amylolyticus]UJR80675.1 Hypothetical protein I5071_27240 [Sandaracinus amylolyticus]